MQGGAVQPPQPERQRRCGQPRVGRRLVPQDVDNDQGHAALAQVGDRAEGAPVEQRREKHHERARRQRGARNAIQVGRDLTGEAHAERHLHDPVELPGAGRRGQPLEHAAEHDHADPVAGAQVRGGQPGRAPDRDVQRGVTGRAHVGERVDHDDQVRRAQGRPLVDERLAKPAGHRPVHVAQPVPGLVAPDAEELDARPGRGRGVVADALEQVGGQQRGPRRRRVREHLGQPRAERQVHDAHPFAAAAHPHHGDQVPPPGVRLQHPAGLRHFLADHHLGRLALGQDHRRAQLDVEAGLVHRLGQGGDDLDVLTFEAAQRRYGDRADRDRWLPAVPDGRERGERGRPEQQEAGVAGQHRHDDRDHRDGGQPPPAWRRLPGH